MKVKALIWEEEENNWWAAQCNGTLLAYEVRLTDRGNVRVRFPSTYEWQYSNDDVEAAKTAAQADYEGRIRAALEAQQP